MNKPTPSAAPAEPSKLIRNGWINTLTNVIEVLREFGRYDDEEGEATDRLQELLEHLVPDAPKGEQTAEYPPLPASVTIAVIDGVLQGFTADQMRAYVDAAAYLRASSAGTPHGAREPSE